MTSVPSSDDVMIRIKKLLSLAQSANENESRLAAQKAQELLTRYNLTRQIIELTTFGEEEHEVWRGTVRAREDKFLLNIMHEFFFVAPIYHAFRKPGTTRLGRRLCFIGEKTNVEIASYVYPFLVRVYRALWKVYRVASNKGERQRGAYYHGLTQGLREQLNASLQKVQTETGLVVLAGALADEMLNRKYPDTISRRLARFWTDADAESAGRVHGKEIRIRRGVEQGHKGAVLEIEA